MNWHGSFLFIHLSDGAARSSLRRLTGTSLSTGDLSRDRSARSTERERWRWRCFLPELKENLSFLFIGGMIVTSFVEYITGRLMEKILHKKWWDYSDQKFHLDGYICLRVSALWGVCSVLMIYFLNPFFCGLVNMIPRLIGEVILWVLLGLLIADGLGSGIAVLELKRKKGRIEQITEELQKTSKFLENALTKRIQKRLVKAFPNIETEKDAEQEEKFAEGCGFFKLASLFIIGAFIGDIVETIFCLITTGRLMSRSSLVFGQFSIVWGIAWCASDMDFI